jgi:predicted transcriptional regulator
MKPNQKNIDIAEWIELDAMKRDIRNVFASFLKTDEISADDINAIHNILFKKKNKSLHL